jgi:hypothetical protein
LDYSFHDTALAQRVIATRTVEELEAAMFAVTQEGGRSKDADRYGKLYWSELDAIVPRVAGKLKLQERPSPKSNERVLILGTAFYGTGGHTRIASDIIAALGPEAGVVVVTTDVYRQLKYLSLLGNPTNNSGLGEYAVIQLHAPTLVEKTLELYNILSAIRPTRIILMSHPMDIVAAAAVWPFRTVVEYLHHADHVPSLGATLPFSAHLDVTYSCHQVCREHDLNARYIGMAANVSVAPSPAQKGERLRIATCGSVHKYRGHGEFRWTDYASAVLHATDAELVHIGPAPEDFVAEVREDLAAAGLDPARYIFTGFQKSLPQALSDFGADIYLSSYPEDGGKANLEAMACDLPTIVPIDRSAMPLLNFSLPLQRYLVVQSPDEISKAIAQALEMRRGFSSPESAAHLKEELDRFEDFVRGRAQAAL